MTTHAEAKRNQLLTKVESIAVPKGYHPLSIMVHTEHETGRFEHIIGWNNFWGIKKPKKRAWNGIVVPVMTNEMFTDNFKFVKFLNKHLDNVSEVRYNERVVKKGEGADVRHIKQRKWTIRLKDFFCDWEREKGALEWYMDLVERLYKPAWEARDNPPEYFKGLVSGDRKWATDPEYVEKLTNLYEQLKKDYP